MTKKHDVVERWKQEPGRTILQSLNDLFEEMAWSELEMERPVGGQSSDRVFELLEGLPLRSEVPSGRDFRGATLSGGVRNLDLSDCDFSYATLDFSLVGCDLSRSRFDFASGSGVTISDRLGGASFVGAKLKGAFLAGSYARSCVFDKASLSDVSFEGTDLRGSSFQRANLKGAQFKGATLLGCDFRGAVLDEAVFLEVELDKSTDLREASLVNLWASDHYDHSGKLVARGTDWTQATFDATTVSEEDPSADALEVILQAQELIAGMKEPQARRLAKALEQERARLANVYDEDWWDDLLVQLPDADKPFAEAVLTRAAESLL